MPSFVCDVCQETLKKARLDDHFRRCARASFSCIDCYKSFKGADEYRAHTSCITEVQKYEKKGMTNSKPDVSNNAQGKKDDMTGEKKRSKMEDVDVQGKTETKERHHRKKHKSSKSDYRKAEKDGQSVAKKDKSMKKRE